MAAPACNNHPDTPAVFIGTFMETGDAMAACDACMVTFSLGMLQALTGIDATPLLEAVSSDTTEGVTPEEPDGNPDEDPADDLADPPPPKVRRGRSLDTSPDPGTDADHVNGGRPPKTPEPAASDA